MKLFSQKPIVLLLTIMVCFTACTPSSENKIKLEQSLPGTPQSPTKNESSVADNNSNTANPKKIAPHLVRKISAPKGMKIDNSFISPNSNFIAVTFKSWGEATTPFISVYNTRTGDEILRLEDTRKPTVSFYGFSTVAFSPSGKKLIFELIATKEVKILNLETNELITVRNASLCRSANYCFSVDEKKMLMESSKGLFNLVVVNTSTGEVKNLQISGPSKSQISYDSRVILGINYTERGEGKGQILDINSHTALMDISIEDISSYLLNPDGRFVSKIDDSRNLTIFRISDQKLIYKSKTWARSVFQKWSPKGKYLFNHFYVEGRDYERTTEVIDVNTGKVAVTLSGSIDSVDFVEDESFFEAKMEPDKNIGGYLHKNATSYFVNLVLPTFLCL